MVEIVYSRIMVLDIYLKHHFYSFPICWCFPNPQNIASSKEGGGMQGAGWKLGRELEGLTRGKVDISHIEEVNCLFSRRHCQSNGFWWTLRENSMVWTIHSQREGYWWIRWKLVIWDIATWASQRVKSSLVVFSTCMEKYKKIENCSIILGEETAFNRIKPSIVKVAPNMWIW